MYFMLIALVGRDGMAEIFISYKSERRAAAEHFAEVLRRCGYTVWFDYELVKGKDFAAQIEGQIRKAKALVALWCSLSVNSRWVREEVYLAHDLGILLPAKIEPCEIPFGFRLADTIDLTAWDGSPRSRALDPLLDAVEKQVGREAYNRKALAQYEAAWRRFGARPLKDFAVDAARRQAETRRFGPEEWNGREPRPSPQPASPAPPAPTPGAANHNHAGEDWKLIELSTDPRDFRAFIEEHKSGFLVRKAQHKLDDLADAAFAAAGRDKGALERFLKAHFDSAHADAARARLAELAAEEARVKAQKAEEERKRQELEARYRAEGRARVAPAIARPAGLEWFLPGAGKAESFKDADFAPEMVVVPAGEFWMGSTDAEIARLTKEYKDGAEVFKREAPRHKVTVRQPFAIGRYAVTFDEWEAAQKDADWRKITGRKPSSPGDEGWGKGRRPVINVDWDGAQAYAKWLSAKTGKAYRLPS